MLSAIAQLDYDIHYMLVHFCYACTYSIYKLHKKLKDTLYNILNLFCVVYHLGIRITQHARIQHLQNLVGQLLVFVA